MALPLYFDVNVPLWIAEGLRHRGIDVLISQDEGTRQFGDADLLHRATELLRILVTHDKDFLRIAASHQAAGWEFAGMIFAPQSSKYIGQYIDEIELIVHCCSVSELENRVFHLPLR
jgi:hypothetical protein